MSEQKGIRTGRLLKDFIPYYGKYKGILVLDLICAALTILGEMVFPLLLRYLTNEGVRDLASVTVGMVVRIGLLYAFLRVIDSLAAYYMAYTGHVMGVYIETDMRQDMFAHLQRLSDSYYSNTKVGQIMSRFTSDLFDVTEFAHHCPEEFFIAAIKGAAAFIILSQINVALTLLIFIPLPIMLICCIGFNRKVKDAYRRQRYQVGELNAQVEDTLLGSRVVRAFGNEALELEKFSEGNRAFMDIKKYAYRYMAAFQISTRSFDGLMYVVVIVAGGIFMLRGLVEPGDLVVYTLYVSTLLTTIRRIIEFAEQFQRGMTGIERFQEIMNVIPDIQDAKDARPIEAVQGAVELEHVSFEYPDDHNPVLEDICLSVKPGEKIALVGPSGGGKTTLCSLITRFYDATEGTIRIDGRDIRGITLKSLRANIGVVQQDVYLFSGSVLENIRYGRPDASAEEVRKAAELAGAHEFIMELKDGYDTYVGERGVKLSGGQKQRISIARVFLKNPAILILDEATSALDNESEYLVSQSLEKLAAGRTTITIAHRLTTIQGADRILVLSGSRIVEEGSHKELLAKKGIYYQLYCTANRLQQVL